MKRPLFTTAKTNFNSHAHVERDHSCEDTLSAFSISTHTLTWSVTADNIGHISIATDFNSHAHVERDNHPKRCGRKRNYFNSHAHVERDFNMKRERLNTADFNSHAHVERDSS